MRLPTIDQLTKKAIMGEATVTEVDAILATIEEKKQKHKDDLKKLEQLEKLAEMVKAGIAKKLATSVETEPAMSTRFAEPDHSEKEM